MKMWPSTYICQTKPLKIWIQTYVNSMFVWNIWITKIHLLTLNVDTYRWWPSLLSFSVRYMPIPILALRDKATLRLLKPYFSNSGCGIFIICSAGCEPTSFVHYCIDSLLINYISIYPPRQNPLNKNTAS
jgi:hypothetical protein